MVFEKTSNESLQEETNQRDLQQKNTEMSISICDIPWGSYNSKHKSVCTHSGEKHVQTEVRVKSDSLVSAVYYD